MPVENGLMQLIVNQETLSLIQMGQCFYMILSYKCDVKVYVQITRRYLFSFLFFRFFFLAKQTNAALCFIVQ